MPRDDGHHDAEDDPDELETGALGDGEYEKLMQLERLESLEEEMMEMGVTSLDDLRTTIAELHRQLDDEQ